jgi:hypothetical protein
MPRRARRRASVPTLNFDFFFFDGNGPTYSESYHIGPARDTALLQKRPAIEALASCLIPSGMSERPPVFRVRFGEYIGHAEVVSYSLLAVLLFVTVLAAITSAGKTLWNNIANRTIVAGILQVLDQLLSVLMVIEILHTVRIFDSLAHPCHRAFPDRGVDSLNPASACDQP